MLLNPLLLLAGLLAVASPVAIHMMRRTPPRPLKWAATRFLRAAHASSKNRLRLQDLILLILRCLVVALLGLALARPMLSGWLGASFAAVGLEKRRAIILIDTSLSMQQTDGGVKLIDAAREAARSVARSLPAGSVAMVWRFDDRVDAAIPEPISSLAAIDAAIDATRASDRVGNLTSAIGRVSQIASPEKPIELFVITDFQRGTFTSGGGLESIQRALRESSQNVRLTLVPVGSMQGSADSAVRPNRSIDSISLADGIATTARPIRIRVDVSRFGAAQSDAPSNFDSAMVRLSARKVDASGVAQIQSLTLDQKSIPFSLSDSRGSGVRGSGVRGSGVSGSGILSARISEPGDYLITAAIDADTLVGDDASSMLIRVRPTFRIGVVTTSAGFGASVATDAPDFFARRALATPGEADSLRFVDIDPSQLETTDLSSIDVLAVFEPRDWSAKTNQSLSSFVDQGGTLLVVPGKETQGIQNSFQGFAAASILPADWSLLTTNSVMRLDESSLDHPVMSLWKSPDSGGVGAIEVAWRLGLKPRANAAVVLRAIDGVPLIVERKIGGGYVLMFGTTLDRIGSNLPLRPGVFVPLLTRAVARGQGFLVDARNPKIGTIVSSAASIQMESSVSAELILRGPISQSPVDQDQRTSAEIAAPIRVIEGRFVAQTDDVRLAGLYEWVASGRVVGAANVVRDSAESDTTLLNADERRSLSQSGVRTSPAPEIGRASSGTEAAGLVLLALILLATAELYFSRRFSPTGNEVAVKTTSGGAS